MSDGFGGTQPRVESYTGRGSRALDPFSQLIIN